MWFAFFRRAWLEPIFDARKMIAVNIVVFSSKHLFMIVPLASFLVYCCRIKTCNVKLPKNTRSTLLDRYVVWRHSNESGYLVFGIVLFKILSHAIVSKNRRFCNKIVANSILNYMRKRKRRNCYHWNGCSPITLSITDRICVLGAKECRIDRKRTKNISRNR